MIELQLTRSNLRFCSSVGLSASVVVIAVNTIVYSYGDIVLWPQWALNLSYWAGSMALAFAALGFVPTYVALRPAGNFWALASSGVFAYFVALGSSGHGSFFAHYSTIQAMQNAPGVRELELLLPTVRRYNYFLFAAAIIALLLGSALYSITVAARPTRYPRWMALCSPFVIAALTIVPGEIEGSPEIVKIISRGLGFHVGLIAHFVLTDVFLHSKSKNDEVSEDLAQSRS